jgi:hypothetical protein
VQDQVDPQVPLGKQVVQVLLGLLDKQEVLDLLVRPEHPQALLHMSLKLEIL